MKKITLCKALWLLLCITNYTPAKVAVWDLGGVCFAPSKTGIAWELNLVSLAFDTILGGNPKARMFEFLNVTFGYQQAVNAHEEPEQWLYATGDGMILPEIWCDNMRGTCSCQELLEKSKPHFDTFFTSRREKNVIKNLMKTIFDPKTLTKHMHPIPAAVKLVGAIAENPNNSCMVLSNYAADSFEELYNKEESQEIFKHISEENLIISGRIGLMKPHNDIYEYLKNKLIQIDPRFADPNFLKTECVFIDDQIENVIAARKCGITALWLHDGDYAVLEEELSVLGLL